MKVDLYFESTDSGSFGVTALSSLAEQLLAEHFASSGVVLTPKQAKDYALEAVDRGLEVMVR